MVTIIPEIETSNIFDNNKYERNSDDEGNLMKTEINTTLVGEYII